MTNVVQGEDEDITSPNQRMVLWIMFAIVAVLAISASTLTIAAKLGAFPNPCIYASVDHIVHVLGYTELVVAVGDTGFFLGVLSGKKK